MVLRLDEAFEFDEKLTVVGRRLEPGDVAPAFSLDSMDPEAGTIAQVALADTAGQTRLLHVVNSLDTPVCHIGAHRWDALRATLPQGVIVYTISMDLPFAQARWQTSEAVTHRMLSAHRDEAFGSAYGVLLKEWRLLQRAIFVIDPAGIVTYAEYVADQMHEPDYDAAVAAAREAAATTS